MKSYKKLSLKPKGEKKRKIKIETKDTEIMIRLIWSYQ